MNFPAGSLPSVMKHDFSMVPKAEIQRSQFDRSHGYKTAFNSQYLIPVYVDEVLPGDTFNLQMSHFARLSTPIVPIMDNMYLSSFFFFVPYRLVWDNFKKFMGEQVNPGDSTSFSMPVFNAYAPASESLSDYMGIPISGATTPMGAGGTITHVSLYHRMYNLIWNEWFRDENLQNSLTVDKGDGPDNIANYTLQKRGKRHDYFTSCLPWTQKGPAQSIPLTGTAPIRGIAARGGGSNASDGSAFTWYESDGALMTPKTHIALNAGFADYGIQMQAAGVAGAGNLPQIFADLSAASAVTINALRQAFQIQKMYERDARGGTRYTEIVRSHFSVVSPDARLQRPEYLGGSTTPITITPVPQTSVTSGSSATGRLSAAGITTGRSGFVKSFTEHGAIIGIVCVTADLNYQSGLHRMFSRSSRLDLFWPALQNLGEQAVLNKEIYAQGSANLDQDALAFGYQERYAEYRYAVSKITGKMRSTSATPVDVWHLAEKFTALPTLGATFISSAPPIDRVVAVTTEPQFFFDAYFNLKCARPMGMFSVPGMIDHF